MGQFPALGMALHRGYITQGPLVAARRLTLDQLFAGYEVMSQPDGVTWPGAEDMLLPNPVAAIGRVTFLADEEVEPSMRGDWSEWDEDARRIESATGELVWDYGERYIEVRAPKIQGVIGFAAGDTLDLGDLTVTVDTPFVSLLAVSFDDLPLRESSKILVSALAQDKQTAAVYEGVGDETVLTTLGGPPLLMEPVQATLAFDGEPFIRAEALDQHGRRVEGGALEVGDDGSYRIDGRHRTFYYLFEREPPPEPEPEPDMGISEMDAGPTPDAGAPMADTDTGTGDDGGCGCDAARDAHGLPWLGLVLLLGLRRRRRAR